jgi:hypothetical protein
VILAIGIVGATQVASAATVNIKLWDAVPQFTTVPVTTPITETVEKHKSVKLDFAAGDTAVLSSTPNGTGPILADNLIRVNGVNICVGGAVGACFIGTVPLTAVPAIDVAAAIPIGETTVLFEWRDFGGVAQTSDIYLVTSAKIVVTPVPGVGTLGLGLMAMLLLGAVLWFGVIRRRGRTATH